MPDQIPLPDINIFRNPKKMSDSIKILREYLGAADPDTPIADRMSMIVQLARAEMDLGNAGEAEKLLHECEPYIAGHGGEEEQACIYHTRAMLYATQTRYAEGIDLALRALDHFRQLNYPYYTMKSLIVCGHLCAEMCLYTESVDYLSQAHQVALEMNNIHQAIMCKLNMNENRLAMLSPAECIRHCRDLLEEIEENFSGRPSYPEACTYLHLAHLHVTGGDIEQADHHAAKSMDVTSQMTVIPAYHLQYINLYAVKAAIAGARDNEAEMLEYIGENIERSVIAKNVGSQIHANFFLFRFYLKRADRDRAKSYLDIAASMIEDSDRSVQYLNLIEARSEYYAATDDRENELLNIKLIYEYKTERQQEAITYRARYASTVHELDIKRRELAQQQSELEYKTQDLNMATYYLQQRNQLLNELKGTLGELRKKPKEDAFKMLEQKIDHAFAHEDDEKARFRERFDEINRDFIVRLRHLYPGMTASECRMCALLRTGLSSKEISDLLSTSIRNVENHRLRIRKKMKLPRHENLNLVLTEMK